MTTSSAAGGAPDRLGRLRAGYLTRAPGIISAFAACIGLLTLIDAVLPDRHARMFAIGPLLPEPATSAVTAVAGLLLWRVAAGLRMRKHVAWQAAVGITIVLAVSHLLRGHKIGQAAIALGLLLMLITARSRFRARADRVTRWFAVQLVSEFLAVATGYGLAMLYLYPRHVVGHPAFWARLQEVGLGLVGVDGPVAFHGERFGDIVHATLLGFGVLTVAVVALVALRPCAPMPPMAAGDEERLRTLLDGHGAQDSLGYFALRRDKSVVWSASGKAAITYRVVGGVALASGDPIGDPEAWPGAIAAFRRLTDERGWTVAVIGCSELGARVFRRVCGLSVLELGDEAVIDVGTFTLLGRQMRGVRQSCTRVSRAGYALLVRRSSEIDPAEFAELKATADAWRRGSVERGFSMALSRLGDRDDGDCVVVTACQDGILRGFLHFVPWGKDGLSLDLMRRDNAADNGLNELLIVELIRQCPYLGVRRVSLNFAVFRDALERGRRIGAGPFLRAWRRVLLVASRWWQIDSLYRFNAKFDPIWQSRHLCYPAIRDLPRVALAALEAEAFLVRPRRLARKPST